MIDYTQAREAMVDCQVRPSDVTKYPIIAAMLDVPREAFVPDDKKQIAYVGEHIALSEQRSLLDPRVFAKMLDVANIRDDELVLDIACGMGYSTAVLSRMAEAVIGVEDDPELANHAATTLVDHGHDNAIIVSALPATGAPKHGPYNVIMLQGAFEVLPDSLASQLKEDGRVIGLRLKDGVCFCTSGIKSNGKITWRHEFDATAPVLDGFEQTREFTFA
ncbi:MAG: protein-L-isoaspartate O-methyltransferase [Pseudomonadota bacterium]